MTVTDFLLWESTNGLLLIPAVIALLMLTRLIRGRPVFTERDWRFSIGEARGKLVSLHFWLRFAALWFTVVLIGLADGYVPLLYGLALLVGTLVVTSLVVLLLGKKRSR
jgi:hypothetical protein